MDDNERYCEPFCMSQEEFQSYKTFKYTRLIWYVIGMVISSIFIDKWVGYVFITLWLIASYWLDAKHEEQWIKDGAITREDLK